jgi:carboxypeptidase Q
MTRIIHLLLVLFISPVILFAQEKLDMSAVEKIKKEGTDNSKVMDIAFQLTDVSGPRLTNSPGYARAANYVQNQLKQWGLTNIKLDPWGEFGKGWELQRSYVAMTAPYYKPFIALPRAWSINTTDSRPAEVLLITAKDSLELLKYKDQLKGKILIVDQAATYRQSFKADATRYTDEDLLKMDTASLRTRPMMPPRRDSGAARVTPVTTLLRQWATQEGAIAVLSYNPRGHDGTLFVSGSGYRTTDVPTLPDLTLTLEDYMTIVRLLRANVPVKVEAEVKGKFYTEDLKGYNVIGEIPGTDLKDEIVMIGAHLDSWHGATGATDNAAGCAVMMEAIRILKASGLKPRRTIRIALWSGEEQGLLGSRGYVKKTFADLTDKKLLPAHEKFSAYYNLDNGTGKIRGIYLQSNPALRSIFSSWFEPFKDSGSHTITVGNTGSTDHVSFTAVGLPGFQFIQDPIEYNTRTHHTNMDTYDHLIAEDLKASAVIVASILYHTANRNEKIPRLPLPETLNGAKKEF